MSVLTGFNIAWSSFALGVVAYPVGKYVLLRWGGATWQDAKKLGYKVWDVVKSTFKTK